MKGVILDAASLGPDDIDLNPITTLPVDWKIYQTSAPEDIAKRIADTEIVLTNKAPIGQVELSVAPKLRYIGVLATGTNVVDLSAAEAKGVVVTNVVGYGTSSVVQHTWALILALATKLPDYNVAALDGRWAESPFFCLMNFPVNELEGKTLGIVGYGQLGKKVAEIGRAFGMNIEVAALPWRHTGDVEHRELNEESGMPDIKSRMPFDQLLAKADVLSLHCPLTEETRNLIGRKQLAMMKNSALLVNCARGGIVHEQALVEALEDGTIAGAGIDVLTEEPPQQGNPLLNSDIPNLIVTPHSAWVAKESRQRLVMKVAENLRAYLSGQPRSLVSSLGK